MGWYLLSPNFGYLFTSDPENVPGAYDPATLQKVVVMMTDGEFKTIYSDGVIAKNSGSGSGGSRYKSDQNCDNGKDSFLQALSLCSNMKTAGVIVCTIGFDIGGSTTIQNFLDNCATDPTHAYVADSGTDLQNVCNDIAVQISRLRLAK